MREPIYATHPDAGPGVGPGRVVPAAENHLDRQLQSIARIEELAEEGVAALAAVTAERDRWRLAHDNEQAERQHLRRTLDRLEAELFAAADELAALRADCDRLRFERDAAEALVLRLAARVPELERN